MFAGVQIIKVLASDVDKLTPKVVSAAVAVNKNPKNKSVKEELDSLKHEWGVKVQQLTGAIDEIIDPEDFMAISGTKLLLLFAHSSVSF